VSDFEVVVAEGVLPSPARVEPPVRPPMRVALVQDRWHPDPVEHLASLSTGVGIAADAGAEVVCLQELTLLPYCANVAGGPSVAGVHPESIDDGPTRRFATTLATRLGVHVHASLYEAAPEVTPLGYNTAICVAPTGELIAATRKVHIPITAGYYEDRYFVPGDSGYPVAQIGDARFGFPTCWDEWFPELARIYSLAGAEVLVYPTAIGSEPDHPDFDTMPLWRQVIVANGITSATFMVVPNRIGTESPRHPDATPITFYGSSFISDPYGRVLVEAPRDRPAVLVADLDLDQRRDWLALFPFERTRRPDTYHPLVKQDAGDLPSEHA